MPYPDPASTDPLGLLIPEVVALDRALGVLHFPRARHHARIVALRSDNGGLDDIASIAQLLMVALGEAIRPSPTSWLPALDRLHHAIDQALEAPESSDPVIDPLSFR